MKFLSIPLIILCLSASSCIRDEEDNRRFHGRNKLEQPEKRASPKKTTVFSEQKSPEDATAPVSDSSKESLIFPFVLSSDHNALVFESIDNSAYKASISAKPEEKPVRLVSGFSGRLSITTNNGLHTLTISSPTNNKVLYFELSEENTTLMSSNEVDVKQKQILAETTKPVAFYVKENGELTVLCFSFDNLSQKINMVKNFPEHPECQQTPP